MFEFGPMIAFRVSRKQEAEELFIAIGDNFFMSSNEEGCDEDEIPLSADGVKQIFADLLYEGFSIAITADFDIEGSRNLFIRIRHTHFFLSLSTYLEFRTLVAILSTRVNITI